MSMYPEFKGNLPGRVSKDAKYCVRSGPNGSSVIRLTYTADEGERWLATADQHPELCAMVDAVKTLHTGSPHGAFYINEYDQVIVPVTDSEKYYLAGTYKKPLRFEFDGKVLSGDPNNAEGIGGPLSSGDTWHGPLVGIPYVLTAGGDDIYYKTTRLVSGGVIEKKVKLSQKISPTKAAAVAAKIRTFKGHEGGRFFINEFRAVFAPVDGNGKWSYTYIGQLDMANWFPCPAS